MVIFWNRMGDQIDPMWDFVSVTLSKVVGRGSGTTPTCG
jgi:hypothetical protein